MIPQKPTTMTGVPTGGGDAGNGMQHIVTGAPTAADASASSQASQQSAGLIYSPNQLQQLKAMAAAGVPLEQAYQAVFGHPMDPQMLPRFQQVYQQYATMGGATNPGQPGAPTATPQPQAPAEEGGTPPPQPQGTPDSQMPVQAAPPSTAGQTADNPANGGTTRQQDAPPATTNAPNQPATPQSSGGQGPQTLDPSTANGGNPTEYDYGFDPNRDSLTSWAGHTFQHATGLGSTMGTNGAPLNPYQSWVKQRYGNQVPISSMLQYLTDGSSGNGPGGVGPQGAGTINALNAFNAGPTAASGQGMDNLKTLADLAQRVHDGNNAGLSQDRVNTMQSMQGEQGANEAESLALAAYTQKYGNLGSDQMMKRLNDARTQYFGSSALSNGPTPYLDFLLKQTGMI